MRLPIFLDTDPGIDDAVAIAAAIFAPELDLQLMTTVAGNVSVEKTHKASFLPLRQELIASVVAHGWSEDRSVQTWKTPQCCSDASACCSSC